MRSLSVTTMSRTSRRHVAEQRGDAPHVVRRDPQAAGAAEDVAVLLAGAPHDGRVDDGHELLEVVARGRGRRASRCGPGGRRGRCSARDRPACGARARAPRAACSVEGADLRGQEAAQAEGVALLVGEREVLVERGCWRRAAPRCVTGIGGSGWRGVRMGLSARVVRATRPGAKWVEVDAAGPPGQAEGMRARSLILLLSLSALVACTETPEPVSPQLTPLPTATATATAPAPAAPPRADAKLLPRKLLFGNPDRLPPRLSPDGKRILFIAPDEGVLNVWVGPAADPKAARPVTHERTRPIRSAFWAETGEHVLYGNDKGGDENFHVFAVDLRKGTQKDLTPFDGVRAEIAEVFDKHPTSVLALMNKRDKKPMDPVLDRHQDRQDRRAEREHPGLRGLRRRPRPEAPHRRQAPARRERRRSSRSARRRTSGRASRRSPTRTARRPRPSSSTARTRPSTGPTAAAARPTPLVAYDVATRQDPRRLRRPAERRATGSGSTRSA